MALKTKFGLPGDQSFYIPKETYDAYHEAATRGAKLEASWNDLLASYGQKYPKEYAELTRRISGKLPTDWEKSLPVYKASDDAQASRKLSEIVLSAIVPVLPELVGGSADLTGSNLTRTKTMIDFQPESTGLGSYKGTYIRFGVREHGMGAIANGLHAYGGIIPFVATFMVCYVSLFRLGRETELGFAELRVVCCRCRPLVGTQRAPGHLGRLVHFLPPCPRIHSPPSIATHDSIGLGEDGPTHQPIETAVHLRAIPNLDFWRPADGNETSAAYYSALTRTHTPSVLSLSRQNLPNLEGSTLERGLKGGYVVHETEGEDLTIVSSGSEVSIALEAAQKLIAEGVKTRVVSLPCWSIFDLQPAEYKLSVLRSGAPILAVEALSVCVSQRHLLRKNSGSFICADPGMAEVQPRGAFFTSC